MDCGICDAFPGSPIWRIAVLRGSSVNLWMLTTPLKRYILTGLKGIVCLEGVNIDFATAINPSLKRFRDG